MARSARILAGLGSGLLLTLAPTATADHGPGLRGTCVNDRANAAQYKLDLWTGFWQLNTLGRTAFVSGVDRVIGSYDGGSFVGVIVPADPRGGGLRVLNAVFTGRRPMRAGTVGSGRFSIVQGRGGRAFSGRWFAKDREGEEDVGALRGKFVSGFWQGPWKTNLGRVVFGHNSPTDKRHVRGRYPWSGGGTIHACMGGLDARLLSGTYRDSTGAGTFAIVLTKNRAGFAGTYASDDGRYRGRWTGERP